ncbi:MAG: hypothetical protein ACHQ50_07715 [Fimbriimonadales bacterium]
MRSRKRFWIAIGALCALAIAIGYLARPEDELAGLRSLNPKEEVRYDSPERRELTFSFHAPPEVVLTKLPGVKGAQGTPYISNVMYSLPSKDSFILVSGQDWNRNTGSTCIVDFFEWKRSWTERAWSAIKHRLGL